MADNNVIIVENLDKSFRLPHEKISTVKDTVVQKRFGRQYEQLHVIDDVSFKVAQGDFFGIVGRNGGGKSTILKLLAGIYDKDAGRVEVTGRLVPLIELGVGFHPELSARENVYLSGVLLGMSRNDITDQYDDIVAFAELARFMDQKLKNFSSGMMVRLAFSIAIHAPSDILLIDEVLAVGDKGFQSKCFDYFESLKGTGKTVVFISHDLISVERFCNKLMYIEGGKVAAFGNPAKVLKTYTTSD